MPVLLDPPLHVSDAEWAQIDDDLNRRELLAGGAAAAVLGVGLAACDSTHHASSVPERRTTRTIATVKGPVRVPADPKRVVCLDPGFSWETLLEVGLKPVGVPVIVPSLVLPGNLDRIRGVPTVVDDSGDWASLDRSYANAVNRSAQLAALTARYAKRVQEIKARYGEVIADQRWALITESSNQVYVWGSRSSAGPVLTAAGATFSKGTPGPATPYAQLSLEELDKLADATVILYGATSTGKPYADTGSLLTEPVFRKLPAAAAGNVFPLPSWFAYCYQDGLAQLGGLEAACARLAA